MLSSPSLKLINEVSYWEKIIYVKSSFNNLIKPNQTILKGTRWTSKFHNRILARWLYGYRIHGFDSRQKDLIYFLNRIRSSFVRLFATILAYFAQHLCAKFFKFTFKNVLNIPQTFIDCCFVSFLPQVERVFVNLNWSLGCLT